MSRKSTEESAKNVKTRETLEDWEDARRSKRPQEDRRRPQGDAGKRVARLSGEEGSLATKSEHPRG